MVGVMDGAVLDGEMIVGIPDLNAVDPYLREAGTEAWKLRAAARDAQDVLASCTSQRGRDAMEADARTALTETLPAFMDTFAVLYDVGTSQFRYSAAGLHGSIDNPDRVAQQALRRYHFETARVLERVDALAERYLDLSLQEHAPMDGYTERFRLEDDNFSTVAGGWGGRLERDTDAYRADGIDPLDRIDDMEDDRYDSSHAGD